MAAPTDMDGIIALQQRKVISYAVRDQNHSIFTENTREVVISYQRYRDARLSIFLLSYKACTHDSTGLSPAKLVFRREM
jgi:hypothetical protein